jgi:hypothetical protein
MAALSPHAPTRPIEPRNRIVRQCMDELAGSELTGIRVMNGTVDRRPGEDGVTQGESILPKFAWRIVLTHCQVPGSSESSSRRNHIDSLCRR